MRKKQLSEITGYEECSEYIIYEDGTIFSLSANRFLKLCTDSKGYKYLSLKHKNAKRRCPKVHRLVMEAFSEDTEKEHINHKDGNKSNNSLNNLEYLTNRENRIHALENDLKDEISYGIAQCDLEGNVLSVFDTAKEALIYLGKNPTISGNIGRCIRGSRETAYGYKWKQLEGSTTREREGLH